MARNEIVKVNIDSECILKALDRQKVSFRELGRRLGMEGISERTVRTYIKKGVCPPYVLTKICEALHMPVSYPIVGPTIIVDIPVLVQVTDAEFDTLVGDKDIPDEWLADFLQRAVPYTED
jgi:hypothetical protein